MKIRHLALGIALATSASLVKADLVLDKVIVDLSGEQIGRDDIELINEGSERMYVAVEPSEILNPDTAQEERVELSLGEESPLFVSPRRLILEPGERRLVRIASVGPAPEIERTFRVRIRPVSGAVEGEESGLKLLIGYDTLVLLRPSNRLGDLEISRRHSAIHVRNNSNFSYEFFDGQACRSANEECRDLRPNRLYPNEEWTIDALPGEEVEFTRIVEGRAQQISF